MEKVERGYIPKKLLFDTRLIDRNLREGFISKQELDEHLDSLQDVSEKAVKVETVEPIVEQYVEELKKQEKEQNESSEE